MRGFRIGLVATWFFLSGVAAAEADPISIAILGAVGINAVAGSMVVAITTFALNLAVGIGLSYLAQALSPKKSSSAAAGTIGTTGKLQAGGAIRRAFMVGRGMTAGSLVYGNTFGAAGNTPNAYLVQVIALSDIPVEGLAGIFVEGEEVTWDSGATPSTEGIPIPEYTVSAVEHLWVRFYDGTQTTADSRLVALFGTDPDRPYTSSRKGTGIAYAVVVALVDETLFSGFPQVKFVLDGIKLYDRRYDTTAGGSGAQRWADRATWEHTKNPVVIAENILRGISYNGQWLFGAQTVQGAQLPFASWSAAASECDVAIDLAVAGTEPQYEAGGEIGFDVQPADALDEILKASNGRLAEIGGRYKVRVGAAGSAVFSFTDNDILSSEQQTFEPFPSLGQTVNAITAKYVSPAEGWNVKDAAPLYTTSLEDDDGGRRQAADVNYALVASGTQVQRLMRSALYDYRAFRKHALPMPPDAFVLEPLDIISWTSTRNGYTAKLFDIDGADDLPNLDMALSLKEVDPNAYDWDPDVDEIPVVDTPVSIVPTPGQPIIDWFAEPYTIEAGALSRPAIRLGWDPDTQDVNGVQFEVRLAATDEVVLTGETDRLDAGSIIVSQNLLSNTAYETRGRYRPNSARPTIWSNWLSVTTPNVGLTAADLDAAFNALLDQLRTSTGASLANAIEELRGEIEILAAQGNGAYAIIDTRLSRIISRVGQRVGDNEASVTVLQQATADLDSALALFFVDLLATTGGGTAEAQFQIAAASAPDGAVSAIEMMVRAGVGGDLATAAIRMAAFYNVALGIYQTRIQFEAERVDLIDSEGDVRPLMAAVIADEPNVAAIVAGTPNTVQSDLRNFVPVSYTLLDDDVTVLFPLGARLGFPFWHVFEQDGTGGWTVSFDASVIKAPAPTINETPAVTTIVQGLVESLVPPVATYAAFGAPGQVSSSSVTLFGVNPAVSGKSVWNLAIDGDFIPPPGAYDLTPLGDDGLQCDGEFWGPGGSAGGYGTTNTNGGTGTATTMECEGTDISAGAGGSTVGHADISSSGGAINSATGGTAGAASGGTNTNGTAGGNGTDDSGSAADVRGGVGAAAPAGGGAQVTPLDHNASNHALAGLAGNDIGGGAGGGSATGTSTPRRVATGGGGSGAKVLKTFGVGVLLQGVTYHLVVGSPGVAGTGSGAVPYGGLGDTIPAFNGAQGGEAYVRLYL